MLRMCMCESKGSGGTAPAVWYTIPVPGSSRRNLMAGSRMQRTRASGSRLNVSAIYAKYDALPETGPGAGHNPTARGGGFIVVKELLQGICACTWLLAP